MKLEINNISIGEGFPPYVIAELSANHNGSIERAKESITAAKLSGASAVKIQTYTADTMTIDCNLEDFMIKGGLWDGYQLYELYKEAETPFEWHAELFEHAKKIGITIFSSPFDETAVDLLEELNTPAYKIASFELVDLPLIKYVAKTKKPLLMSTGMASEEEIHEAVAAAREAGCDQILLFHCISSYPAPIEQANLKQMHGLRDKFGVVIGLSDHTIGNTAAITATGLGASAIEKHFTLSRNDKGPDSEFSIEPSELKDLIAQVNDAWSGLGSMSYQRPPAEQGSLVFRRSLYFVKDLESGHVITKNDIRRIRPGHGLPPKYFDDLLGLTLTSDVNRGEPVKWDVINK
jgi:N-acetylneuraminate synthase